MILVCWNVNHRGSKRRIAPWISEAILAERPTVVALTEYIEGPDHSKFLETLRAGGLPHHLLSQRGAENGIIRENATEKDLKGNQILILSSKPISPGEITAPDLAWLRPNALHARVDDLNLELLGVRIPSYKGKERQLKSQVWTWLLETAQGLKKGRVVITGDFNTSLGDSATNGGDHIKQLASSWQRADTACTFVTLGSHERTIDHVFLSPALHLKSGICKWRSSPSQPHKTGVGIPDHAMLVVDFE